MSGPSKIERTGHTWNPVAGCSEALPLIGDPGSGWAGMCRIGKDKAGPLLDRVKRDAMPERRADSRRAAS
jgi:hypothetical protein